MSNIAALDLNILRALSTKARFVALRGSVPVQMLDQNTNRTLDWFDLYFNTHPDHLLIDPSALMTMIRLRGQLDESNLLVMGRICELIAQPLDNNVLQATVQALEDMRLSGEVGALLARYNNGEEVDIAYETRLLASTCIARRERTTHAKWADDDPLVYIEQAADDSGLKLDLFPQFAENLKGLRAGHNVGVGASTDVGKTSLLCAVATCLAKQAKTVHPEKPLLYLVNEGMAETITPRMYQTVVGVDNVELLRLARAGELLPRYVDVVGRRDAIRLVNIHGLKLSAVSRIIEAHEPYAVISDMTGRISANSNIQGGANDIGQLEEVWNGMRELAAILQFIHFGTAQISAEGHNEWYPQLSAIQNSKTGIQTTWDLAVYIGRCNAMSGMEDIRGISTPKNKLARSGKKGLNQFQVAFDPGTNRWDGGIQVT